MRLLFAILTFAMLTACASARNTTASREAPGPVEGTYEFFASVAGQQVQGQIRVVADTILFDAANDCGSNLAPPGPIVAPYNSNFIRYACNGVVLDFDRRNPGQSSKWFAGVLVQKRRDVCAEYTVRNGREVCVRTRPETYETTESRSGRLHVQRSP